MTRPLRARHAAVAGAALISALTLAACGADDPGDGANASATATATSTATATASTASTADASIDGEPAASTALASSDELTASLASASDEFGDVDVDLLQLYPDHASLIYVDPADPGSRHRTEFRDSTWSAPSSLPRPDGAAPLPLDAIDPSVLQSAIEAAPGLLGINDARLSHVSVSPDESGEVEYLVALATGDSLGRATFGPDGQLREVRPPR